MFKRSFWVWLHRWAGLSIAGFLMVVSLTGSILAFYEELEQIINPHWYPVHARGTALDAATLAERVEAREPRLQVRKIELQGFDGTTAAWIEPGINPLTGKLHMLDYNRIILDPVSGNEIERHQWGAISDSWRNLMSFVYNLHYSLALGMAGVWILGICALVWTIDCFVGCYLTLPARKKNRQVATAKLLQANGNDWWQRWKPAWKIRWRSSNYKFNFDLHRANGLWFWILLIIFAWSSVYMNLWDTVYTWTTRTVFEYKAPWTELRILDNPIDRPGLNWRQAQTIGEALMGGQAHQHGFVVKHPVKLQLDRKTATYTWQVHSDREIGQRSRRTTTQVIFDANNGELKMLLLPTGQYTGNTITNWLYALHMANIFGLPYRIFVCLFGLVITMLSVTGIIIWMKKRQARAIVRAS